MNKISLILSFILISIYLCDGKGHHKHDLSMNKLDKLEHEEFLPVHSGPGARRSKKDRHDTKGSSLTIGRDELLTMPHLHFSKGECSVPCAAHEVCVKDNKTEKPICVKKRFLKESRRLFKMYKKGKLDKFHKRGKKLWKKFGRKHMKKLGKLGKRNRFQKLAKKIGKHHNIDLIEIHMAKKHDKKEIRDQIMKHGQELLDNVQDINSLLETEKHSSHKHASCNPEQLEAVRKRIGGWFSVLHEEQKEKHGQKHSHHGHKKHRKHHLCSCSQSAHWEFRRLDTDHDHHLTDDEMYSIEHNRNEPCIKPLLHSCDLSRDGKLSRKEWCCCFSGIGPCSEKLMSIEAGDVKKVTNIPHCRPDGFYDKVQCNVAGECWCSDLDGNEMPNTKVDTRKDGHPHCGELDVFGHRRKGSLLM